MNATHRFDCHVTAREGVKVFHMKGRLMDQKHADELVELLGKELDDEHKNVALDMSELEYMNSTGLNIMINVLTKTRNMGGDAVLCALSKPVQQLFLVTKLDSVFKITGTVDEAVANFKS